MYNIPTVLVLKQLIIKNLLQTPPPTPLTNHPPPVPSFLHHRPASLDPSGVYKGLHLSSTASPSPAAPAPVTTTPTPALLHPCTTSATSNNNGTAHPANTTTTTTATTQVLLGNNNSLRLGVPTGKRVHAPRTLSTTMSTSALKLAHAAAATANCQKPKVTTASASPLDIVPR